MPRVSLVILSWNALDLLKKCFASVVATDYPDLEVIYADNASTDGSADWVAEHFPSVRVIRHAENYLFCKGNNEAIRQATGKYVVLLNNDIETPPGWLAPLVNAAEADSRIAALQPKILQYHRRDRFGYGGAAGGFLDRMGYTFTRGHIFGTRERDNGQYDYACDLDFAGGCALFLRQNALERTGLLDERFQMHMEEVDLCWRLRNQGYRVACEPTSHVFHVRGDTDFNYVPWRLYFNIRNSLWMLHKNLTPKRFLAILVQKAAVESVLAAGLLVRGQWKSAASILRGYRDAYCMKGNVRAEQPECHAERAYHGSILWDYFIRRRRTFAELPAKKFRLPKTVG